MVLNTLVVSGHWVDTTKVPDGLVCDSPPLLSGGIAMTDMQYRLSLPTDISGVPCVCVSVPGWGGQTESSLGFSLAADPDCTA